MLVFACSVIELIMDETIPPLKRTSIPPTRAPFTTLCIISFLPNSFIFLLFVANPSPRIIPPIDSIMLITRTETL